MRARYTAKDQKPEDVEIREFVERQLRYQSGLTTDVDKTSAALARLIDVLAEKDSLSGGEVLAVLGFHDGQLELDDGTPRTDAEWADYWAASDAAIAKDRAQSTEATARFNIPLPPEIAGIGFYVVETANGGWVMEAVEQTPRGWLGPGAKGRRIGDVREHYHRAAIDAWSLALKVERAAVTLEKRLAFELGLARALGRAEGQWQDLLAEVSELGSALDRSNGMAAEAVARMDSAPFQNIRSQDESAEEFRARLQAANRLTSESIEAPCADERAVLQSLRRKWPGSRSDLDSILTDAERVIMATLDREQERLSVESGVALDEDSAAYAKIWGAIKRYAEAWARHRGQWHEELEQHQTIVDRAIQANRAVAVRRESTNLRAAVGAILDELSGRENAQDVTEVVRSIAERLGVPVKP